VPEKCHVHNCTQPVVARGLCRKHYMRVQRHGDVGETRPADWGKREEHPAYKAWCNLRRHHRQDIPEEWREDFWAFVKEVPEKPERSQVFRPDPTQPWSKDNFYWKERRETAEDIKEYMRVWHQKSRAADPEYYADKSLRRAYGITLEWYRERLAQQNNVCAICKQPETAVIRGKVISMPVDHDHKTGSPRGLLCTKCNRGLGLFSDSVDNLQEAVNYLMRYAKE
jgi:NADH:ubiquinone oxidoreductase 49 kD subunit 7